MLTPLVRLNPKRALGFFVFIALLHPSHAMPITNGIDLKTDLSIGSVTFEEFSIDDLDAMEEFYHSLTEEEVIDFHLNLLMENDEFTEHELDRFLDALASLNHLSLKIFHRPMNRISLSERERLIEAPEARNFAISLPDPDSSQSAIGCWYEGATKYDRPLTEAADYRFQGHMGLYFRVYGTANCYWKICTKDTWGSDCGNGKIPFWSVLCKDGGCPWYWWNSKQVKDIVMLVPKSWWYSPQWWIYGASTKASWFDIYWRWQNSPDCCDPGC